MMGFLCLYYIFSGASGCVWQYINTTLHSLVIWGLIVFYFNLSISFRGRLLVSKGDEHVGCPWVREDFNFRLGDITFGHSAISIKTLSVFGVSYFPWRH